MRTSDAPHVLNASGTPNHSSKSRARCIRRACLHLESDVSVRYMYRYKVDTYGYTIQGRYKVDTKPIQGRYIAACFFDFAARRAYRKSCALSWQ